MVAQLRPRHSGYLCEIEKHSQNLKVVPFTERNRAEILCLRNRDNDILIYSSWAVPGFRACILWQIYRFWDLRITQTQMWWLIMLMICATPACQCQWFSLYGRIQEDSLTKPVMTSPTVTRISVMVWD